MAWAEAEEVARAGALLAGGGRQHRAGGRREQVVADEGGQDAGRRMEEMVHPRCPSMTVLAARPVNAQTRAT